MGGSKQVVTFFTSELIHLKFGDGRPCRVDISDIKFGINGHNRRRNGIKVFDLFIGSLALGRFLGHIHNVFQGAFNITFGILDGSTRIFDGYNHTVFRPGNGFGTDHRIRFHGTGTGALLCTAMGGFKKIIALFADGFVRCQARHRRSCRVHERYVELTVNGHNGCGNSV